MNGSSIYTGIKTSAIRALTNMYTAIVNMRLFAPSNPTISNFVGAAYADLCELFNSHSFVVFSESEGVLFISGERLSEGEQKKPQAAAFVDLLLKFDIKSITFQQGLEKEELRKFLKILSDNPEDLETDSHIRQVVETAGLHHILVNNTAALISDKDFMATTDQRLDIFDKLSYELSSGKPGMGSQLSEDLCLALYKLTPEKRFETLCRISGRLLSWIEIENSLTRPYRTIIHQLDRLAHIFLRRCQFSEAIPIVEAFSRIDSGKTQKRESIKSIAGKALDTITTAEVLDNLLKEIGTNKQGKRNEARDILAGLGRRALISLLDILLESPTISERKQVLQLILKIGDNAIPSVIERIKPGEAWFYLRNLALLLGKLGNEVHVKALEPLLGHEDVRVKREALNAIFKIGGEYRGEIFLSALPQLKDSMKAQVVELLGKIGYQGADQPLIALLASRPFFRSKAREELEEKICMALASLGSQRAIPVLGSIVEIDPSSGVEPYSERVKTAAANALAMIRKKQVQEGGKKEHERVSDAHALESKVIEKEDPGENKLLQQEQLADRYIREGNQQAAIRVLFNLVVEYAKGKNFKKAEAFRDKLFEVDSMALSEIVQSNEIIDEEKREFIDQYHLKIWSDLYDTLTTEEANALYYAMENGQYDPDQAVFEQGSENRHLYFIDRGRLKTVYSQGGREILLKILGKGDVAGSDTFFSSTTCTTSVITLSHSKLKLLDRGVLEKLKDEFPSLVSKLKLYCLKFEKVHDLLKKRDLDRRSQKRISVQGKGMVQLLNDAKKPIGRPFGADFADISAGGLCFVIKLPNRKSARLLLGRHLHAKFTLTAKHPNIKIDHSGTVSAVHSLPFNDYSIHVKLDKPLSQIVLRDAMHFSHASRQGSHGP